MAQIEPVVVTIKMKPRERYVYIAIIIALLLITFIQHNAIRKARQARDKEFSEFNQRVQDKEKQIDSARVLINTIAFRSRHDSATFKAAIDKTTGQLIALRARNQAQRPKIQPALDSLPELRDFVISQDSVIEAQSELIFKQETAFSAQIHSLNEIIALNKVNDQVQASITADYESRVQALEDKVKKTERKLKRQKAFTRIVGGVAFALSLGLIATSQ